MKDLFLLLDSAILKGKGPPPPPTTSKNIPSTKDQAERNQRTAATETTPKTATAGGREEDTKKNHSPEAAQKNPRPPRGKAALSMAENKVQRNFGELRRPE